MTVVLNHTSLAHLRFSNTDNRGYEFGVLMLKATFDITKDGQCILAAEQEPFNFTDVPHGVVNESALKHPSDFVAWKPVTDVIVNAVAHAPKGKPLRQWSAGLQVVDAAGSIVEKAVNVLGPRFWEPTWRRNLTEREKEDWRQHRKWFSGWKLTEPEPAMSVPMRYEYAFGGTIEKKIDESAAPHIEAYPHNPIGCGLIDPDWTDHLEKQPAPQIEAINEPIVSHRTQYRPAGLGPIPAAWLPRLPLAGTYDQNWIDTIWPRWPPDYDFAFNNSAPDGLRSARDYLTTPFAVDLLNLRSGGGKTRIDIPEIDPILIFAMADGTDHFVRPALDTIYLDIAADDLFDCRVSLTWRTAFHRADTESIDIAWLSPAEHAELAKEDITIRTALTPSECGEPCDQFFQMEPAS
ncbi:DUF2169 family type VI secretion system accessory protein [Tabrizicola sp.]|uniref:DUF2169 family type VI secretion system accessory protein n=1 Tax=Tabrizicola sp. TaxID=2005166 RepID=UPI003F3576F6